MKKSKSEVTQEYGFLKVDGRYFESVPDGDRLKYLEVDKKKVDGKINLVKKIAEKLKDKLDREKVLCEALCKLDIDYLEQILGTLNSPVKKKIQTRKHHCVDMKIGKFVIPLINN